MAYTNAWNTTDPPGTEQAKNIDDHIRRVRLDVGERMADLTNSWSADPVVLKDVLAGKKTGVKVFIHGSAFIAYDMNGVTVDSVTFDSTANAPLSLMIGTEITRIDMLLNKGSASTLTWYLKRKQFVASPPAIETLATVAHSSNGNVISDTTGIVGFSHTIEDGYVYCLIVTPSSGEANFTIWGAKLTVNTPRIDA